MDEITGGIVDAACKLHTGLGPGLLESVYETALARDLRRRDFQVERQKLPVGLLINFGAPTLKQGLQRIVNGLDPSVSPREPKRRRPLALPP